MNSGIPVSFPRFPSNVSSFPSPRRHFTATQPIEVKVDGAVLEPGVGYFATVDAVTQTLWLTLNGQVSAPINFQVR